MDPSKGVSVLGAMWGSDSGRITGQYAEYGLKGKMPLFGVASFASEDVLSSFPLTAEGLMSAYTYCGTLDTPENKRFVEGLTKRYKAMPGSYQTAAPRTARPSPPPCARCRSRGRWASPASTSARAWSASSTSSRW